MDSAAPTVADAWQALSRELHQFLRSRLPNEADAEDLLQDVFIRVMENLGSLRQSDRLTSWVYQIARNEIAGFYRRRAPRPHESVEEAVASHDQVGNGNHAVGAWLSTLIAELPPALSEAVRMYELENLPQAEIARRLNVTLSGAKSKVQRGRRQLEKVLRDSCEIELDRRGNVIECKPVTTDCGSEIECRCREGETE